MSHCATSQQVSDPGNARDSGSGERL